MRTLTQIKRDIVSFYRTIQTSITDFNVGSVVNDIIFSFSAVLEDVYTDVTRVQQQAYVATATGRYLDRLIEGTFGLARRPATRNIGYVMVYAHSPIPTTERVELVCAGYNEETQELSNLSRSTKFVGFNNQGEDGIVYTLVPPQNTAAYSLINNTLYINLPTDRPVQYMMLPVVSVLRGSATRVREGAIYSFPNPPTGVSGVINTNSPASVLFSSAEATGGAPFFSRFTEVNSFNPDTNTLVVLNSFNFSPTGRAVIERDTNGNTVSALYRDDAGLFSQSDGILFPYNDAGTNFITLTDPLSQTLPTMTMPLGAEIRTLTLRSVTYNNITTEITSAQQLANFLFSATTGVTTAPWEVRQRPEPLDRELVFDPDSVLTPTLELSEFARIGGAADQDTDAEYRQALRTYLAGLGRATPIALEAGTLQVPGIAFANTLPSYQAPFGSAIMLAADADGLLGSGMRGDVREELDRRWKAAGVNLIVKPPQKIPINLTLSIVLTEGVTQSSIIQQVNSECDRYFRGIAPGEILRYSDLLSVISNISGVNNVFNLLMTRGVTTPIYRKYKNRYDRMLMEYVFGNPNFHTVGVSVPPEIDIPFNSYDRPGDAVWNVFSSSLQAVQTASDFISLVLSLKDRAFTSTQHALYVMSYLFSQPIVGDTGDFNDFPVNPDLIRYQDIKDYNATSREIFRINSVLINSISTPLIGIRFTEI